MTDSLIKRELCFRIYINANREYVV